MKTQRYRLLTTLIVSALHPNEPHQAGTVWAPNNAIDVREANELVGLGYAEKSDGKTTNAEGKVVEAPLASLVLDRQHAARERQATIDRGEDPDQVLRESVVTDDNTGGGGDTEEAVLKLILDGNVAEVTAELAGLTAEQLQRLAELEIAGQGRKGVAEAVVAATEALSAE